ncbi:unnamed protein product [Knipowitschia caucasica]|uniref:Uncharacterized protein n=1 Tax=Knipowitschia caucasica TaxID=637954 RepID=A0AAV2K713_KNICA
MPRAVRIPKGPKPTKTTNPTRPTNPTKLTRPTKPIIKKRPKKGPTKPANAETQRLLHQVKKQVEDLVGQMFAEFTATEYEENEDGDKYIYVRAGGEVLRIVVSRDGSVQFFGDE